VWRIFKSLELTTIMSAALGNWSIAGL
jgi:hypothetical protein